MLRYPIVYLERRDFTSDGKMVPELRREPVLVMIQSSACGHCNVAKPAFQSLANEGVVKCMTIQGDGERQSERDIVPIMSRIYPNFRGYPSYMMFMPDGRKIPHVGGRDVNSLKNFVRSVIRNE